MSLVLLILPLIISWVCLIKTINKLPSEELVSIKFIDRGGEGGGNSSRVHSLLLTLRKAFKGRGCNGAVPSQGVYCII